MLSCPMRKQRKRTKRTRFGKDKRRKHRHFEAKVFYKDGEVFVRRYTDREKARAFAARQRKSPVVRMARVIDLN